MAWQVVISFIAIVLISQSHPVQSSGEAVWLNSSTSKGFLNFFTDFLFYTGVFTEEQMEDIYAITETILTLQEQMELLMKSQSSILQAINMAFASSVAKVIVLDSGGASLDEERRAVLLGIKSAYQYTIGAEDPVFLNEINEMISLFSQSSLQETDTSSFSSSIVKNARDVSYSPGQLEVNNGNTLRNQQLAAGNDFTASKDVIDYNFPKTDNTLKATILQNQVNKGNGISTLNSEMSIPNAIVSQNDFAMLSDVLAVRETKDIKSTTSESAGFDGSGLNMISQYYPQQIGYSDVVDTREENADMRSPVISDVYVEPQNSKSIPPTDVSVDYTRSVRVNNLQNADTTDFQNEFDYSQELLPFSQYLSKQLLNSEDFIFIFQQNVNPNDIVSSIVDISKPIADLFNFDEDDRNTLIELIVRYVSTFSSSRNASLYAEAISNSVESVLKNSGEFSQLAFEKINKLPDVIAAPNRGATESFSFSEDNVPVGITPYTSEDIDIHSDNDELLPFRRNKYDSEENAQNGYISSGHDTTELPKRRRIVSNRRYRKKQRSQNSRRQRRPYIVEDETLTSVSFGTDVTEAPFVGDSQFYQSFSVNPNEHNDINYRKNGAEEVQSPSVISYDSGEPYRDYGDNDSKITYNKDKGLTGNLPEVLTNEKRNFKFVDSLRMKLLNSNEFLQIFDSGIQSEQAISVLISALEVLSQKLGFNDIITSDLIQLVTQYISSTESSANAFYCANAISNALSEILVNMGLLTDETAFENADILGNAITKIIRTIAPHLFQRSNEFTEIPGSGTNPSMDAGDEEYTHFSESQKYDVNDGEDFNDVDNRKTDYISNSQDNTDSVEYPETENSLNENTEENIKQETFETLSTVDRLSSASVISRISAIVAAVKSVKELNAENILSLVNQLRPLISSNFPDLQEQDILLEVFLELSSALINIINSSNLGIDIPFSENYVPIVAEVLRSLQ